MTGDQQQSFSFLHCWLVREFWSIIAAVALLAATMAIQPQLAQAATLYASGSGATAPVSGGHSTLDVWWSAPSDNGAAISDYDVEYRRAGFNTPWATKSHVGTATSTTISGLAASTYYQVRVRAQNSVGESAWSDSGSANTAGPPAAPAAPSVSAAASGGHSTLDVWWSAPSDNGAAISDYDVEYRRAGLNTSWATKSHVGTATSTTISGLAASTYYQVRVRAHNSVGESSWSSSGSGATSATPCASATVVNQSLAALVADCEALWAFYRALTDKGAIDYIPTTAWSGTNRMQNWRGVTITDGRVTLLDLSGYDLSGPIPAELADLTNLTHLNLQRNDLSGPIPAELGNLANLTHLNLQRNDLLGRIPAELGNLANLTHLNLQRNDLLGRIPAELGNLANLTHLNLQRNDLLGRIPAELGNLANLTHLNLQRNDLLGRIPAELGNLANLTHLD